MSSQMSKPITKFIHKLEIKKKKEKKFNEFARSHKSNGIITAHSEIFWNDQTCKTESTKRYKSIH